MIATGVSEFTFGFAFLFEQATRHWVDLRVAPVLPSLTEEGDRGWDARLPLIGRDYYYQFKLTDMLHAWNAKYILDGTYHEAYYRIALHRRHHNRQHRRLKEHAEEHPDTYYVAPEFSDATEFNASFLERQIVNHSRLIPLADCEPIADGEQHYITFQAGHLEWLQHSETTKHLRSETGREIDSLYRRARANWVAIDRGFAERLLETTTRTIRRQLREGKQEGRSVVNLLDARPERGDRAGYLQQTADLLSVFYGLTLVLVGEPGSTSP